MKRAIIRIYKFFKSFFARLRANHVDVYAAAAAFYMFICAVPFILALFSIVPFTPLTEEMVLNGVGHLIPPEFKDFALSLTAEVYDNRATILSVSAVAAIWSAARFMMSLRKGLDEVFHIMEPYNYVIFRLKSMLYTIFVMIVMVVETMFGAFGQYILNFIDRFFPESPVSGSLGQLYTNLIFIVSAFILLVLLYSLVPHKKQKFRTQLVGAMVSTICWVGFSRVFSLYLNYAKITFSMYGSLATIILLMLWLLVDMYILFMGAQINSDMADHRYMKQVNQKNAKNPDLFEGLDVNTLRPSYERTAQGAGEQELSEKEKKEGAEESAKKFKESLGKVVNIENIKRYINNQ
ncbi:MAG: YihY/virulence factor BrkB family protein [Lachnospiraceae bacterium]|nr:YihY/virulence factor BrkB family protein [Lachnospiraceae bacterium]